MRTTIDLPEPLYRKTKALAALQGTSMKAFILRALEREIAPSEPVKRRKRKFVLPEPIHLKGGGTLDLSNFNFDDLLA